MIRRYNLIDIEKISKLEDKVFGYNLSSYLKINYQNDFLHTYVIEENNEIIGYISTNFDGEVLEILNFCIEPQYQHKHYGSQLFDYLLNDIKGIKRIILEVNEINKNAISFYQKYNFNIINVRKNYYENKYDAYLMEKVIWI